MTSRQIVIKLIDENKINGEEAVQLLNDIIIAEIEQAKDVLDQCKKKTDWNHTSDWTSISYPNTSPTIATPTWTVQPSTTTATIAGLNASDNAELWLTNDRADICSK